MTGINPKFNGNSINNVGGQKQKKGSSSAQDGAAKAQSKAPSFKGTSADILNSLNNAAKAGETMAAMSRISHSLQGFDASVGKHLQSLGNDGIDLNNIDVALAVSQHLADSHWVRFT